MLIHLICLLEDGFTILRLKTNEHSFKGHSYTECATSKTEHEPQGGEIANAELDGQYKRLRRVVAKLAHKAQWHNKWTIPIYASAARCTQRASDCYEVNRVRVVPRYAVTVGSLLRGNGDWENT